MKWSNPQRWLFELINLTLALTFTVPLSALLAKLLGFDSFVMSWVLCLAGIGYITGRLTLRAPAGVAMLGCFGGAGAAVAALIVLLNRYAGGFAAHRLGAILYCVAMVAAAIYFFYCARKAGFTIYAPMSIAGILLHIAVLLFLSVTGASEHIQTFCSWAAIVFFLLSLYAFNARGLRKSLHAGEKQSVVRLPRGMQFSSFLLVSGFVILAALISTISPLFALAARWIGALVLALIRGFNWLLSIFDQKGYVIVTQDEPLEDGTQIAPDFMGEIESTPEAAWVGQMVNIFAMIVVAILGMVLLYLFYQKFLKGLKGVQEFLNRMRGMFAPQEDEDFVDETESLFSWKKALGSATEGIRTAVQKITDRPQKIDDFSDNRMKIRFAYQQVLAKLSQKGSPAACQTPNEVLDQHLSPAYQPLIDAYNQVRYQDSEADGAQVAAAKELLKQKL